MYLRLYLRWYLFRLSHAQTPALGQFGQKFAKKAKALREIDGESDATMAERVGFEPTVPVKVLRISSAVQSTTLPPLRIHFRPGGELVEGSFGRSVGAI